MILNDKIHKAKERHIDLSVFVDFSEITFIEPLDISTIFGNAIDNALNACDELPAEKRIVSVKCRKKENFVLIRIENNCSKSEDMGKRKADKGEASMHGYGIPNMERAVQKYGGECKIVRAEGRFVLTIMIPFPV